MKAIGMALCALSLFASAASVRAQQTEGPPLTAEQQTMLRSLMEVNNRRATVIHVFEYCARQDDGFATASEGILEGWRTRNLPYTQLTGHLQEDAVALGNVVEGLSREDALAMFEASAQDVALEFSRNLDEEDIPVRVHVCQDFAGKIRDGEFDIGRNKPEVKAYLDRLREASR